MYFFGLNLSLEYMPLPCFQLHRFILCACFGITVFISKNVSSQGEIERMAPPHWWLGFANDTLDLLVYGKKIGPLDVHIAYPGVQVLGVKTVGNPNYLILQLEITDQAKAGEMEILFSKPGRKRPFERVKYELRERQLLGQRPEKGLNPEDLMYLIMPDRFDNGDPSNDAVKGMREMEVDRSHIYKRHGGDLQGVIDRLDYLEGLGVTALWLNPVLENDQPKTSYHGYACTDGYRIDPRFGSNRLYKSFVDSLHSRNMKIVMDVVYNHWGSEHWLIRDLPDSMWVNQWPEFTQTNYRSTTWMDPYASQADRDKMRNGWFDKHMPDLNQRHPDVARYLIQQTKWWVEEWGIDALRIDTYAYPDQEFMAYLGRELVLEYPDLFLFGETWVHGVPIQSWFTQEVSEKKEFDSFLPSVTDFQMYFALKKGLNESFGWTEGASRIYYALAKDWVYQDPLRLVTFVDNHDLSRFYSEVQEDPKRFHMGLTLIMTTRGIPCLYYGTEIRMRNFADPDGKVRSDFPGGWKEDPVDKFRASGRDSTEQVSYELIKTLGQYRRNHPDLFQGKLMQFAPQEGIYTYFRYTNESCLMVVFNMNSEPKQLKPERFIERTSGFSKGVDLFTHKVFDLKDEWNLEAMETLVLELTK